MINPLPQNETGFSIRRIPLFEEIRYTTIVHLRSVDPWKLRVGVKYSIVHMYSMPYYTCGSTANFLVLEPTALIYIYISKEWLCDEGRHGVGNVKIE